MYFKTIIAVVVFALIANLASLQANRINENELELLKERSLLNLIERNLNAQNEHIKREDNEEEEESNANNDQEDNNNGNSNNNDDTGDNGETIGEGIFITLAGNRVNICQKQYINMAGDFHPQMKELMKTACQGSSSARWVVKKIAQTFFTKKQPSTP